MKTVGLKTMAITPPDLLQSDFLPSRTGLVPVPQRLRLACRRPERQLSIRMDGTSEFLNVLVKKAMEPTQFSTLFAAIGAALTVVVTCRTVVAQSQQAAEAANVQAGLDKVKYNAKIEALSREKHALHLVLMEKENSKPELLVDPFDELFKSVDSEISKAKGEERLIQGTQLNELLKKISELFQLSPRRIRVLSHEETCIRGNAVEQTKKTKILVTNRATKQSKTMGNQAKNNTIR